MKNLILTLLVTIFSLNLYSQAPKNTEANVLEKTSTEQQLKDFKCAQFCKEMIEAYEDIKKNSNFPSEKEVSSELAPELEKGKEAIAQLISTIVKFESKDNKELINKMKSCNCQEIIAKGEGQSSAKRIIDKLNK